VLPWLPSIEKNSSDHHNSYNKSPNLAFFSFIESPSNSLPTIKFTKNHITSSYQSNMPKIAKAKIWPLRTLGVKWKGNMTRTLRFNNLWKILLAWFRVGNFLHGIFECVGSLVTLHSWRSPPDAPVGALFSLLCALSSRVLFREQERWRLWTSGAVWWTHATLSWTRSADRMASEVRGSVVFWVQGGSFGIS
jgi:hypothetical protein